MKGLRKTLKMIIIVLFLVALFIFIIRPIFKEGYKEEGGEVQDTTKQIKP